MFEFDLGFDEIWGEYVIGKEKFVVGFEIVEDCIQVVWYVIYGGMFFRREFVDVFVDWCGWFDFVLDVVQVGQQQGGKGYVRVGRWIWVMEFDVFGFWIWVGDWDMYVGGVVVL